MSRKRGQNKREQITARLAQVHLENNPVQRRIAIIHRDAARKAQWWVPESLT